MTTKTDSVLGILMLIDRLAALIQGLGARVRQAQAEGRPISELELDEQAQNVADAIERARDEIAAKRARS